ncbi:MAG: cell wall hydrolase [Symploca sp. SIO2E9]|nr:cell wall hydrolase [Symploca sp. SIO2E9]
MSTEKGEINIIGIEGINLDGTYNNDRLNQWNDLVGILLFERSGKPYFDIICRATTEPGKYFTDNPYKGTSGVARIDTGYHKELWQVGDHRGYEALAQGSNSVRLVRDENKDGRRNDEPTNERNRGINLHTTKSRGWRGSASPNSIGKWSAGCVVIYSPNDFLNFLDIVKSSRQYQENKKHSFDFTLLYSRWIKVVEENSEPISPTEEPYSSATPDDLDIMARTIWGEVRAESDEEKIAVGWVIRNRASRSPRYNWKPTLCEVCKQRFQFSAWNKDDVNLQKVLSVTEKDDTFKKCLEISKKVVSGEVVDISNGADHFHARYTPKKPAWAIGNLPVSEVGLHSFYRLVFD